jgi:hypothetical protein
LVWRPTAIELDQMTGARGGRRVFGLPMNLDRLREFAPREFVDDLVREYQAMGAMLRDLKLELTRSERALCDERLERHKLKMLLREAIRHWIRLTPNVEDVVSAWEMARTADLTQ